MERKRPSLAAIAELAGVSKSTVSLALSNSEKVGGKTRQEIQRLAEEMGYLSPRQRAAARPAPKRTIGVLLDREFDWAGEQFFTRIIHSLQEEAERDGQQTFFMTVSRDKSEQAKLPALLGRDLHDALVLVGMTEPSLVKALQEGGKPMVLVSGGTRGATEADSVLNDDFQGMEQVVRHLVGLGHRRIALIGGRLDHDSNLDRYRAFRIHMDELVGEVDQSLVLVDAADASVPEGRMACNALLNRGADFTALVCMTDDMAYGALEGLKQRGIRVPEDVSVVGFNDLPMSEHAEPPLTSVRIGCEELGRAAYQVIRAKLDGSGITHPLRMFVGTELRARKSTGPASTVSAQGAGPRTWPAPTRAAF